MATTRTEITVLKRQRTGQRGWLTRAINKLNALIDTEEVTKEEIELEIEEIINRKGELKIIQEKVEISFENEDELAADIESAEHFVSQSNSVVARARHKLTRLAGESPEVNTNGSNSSSTLRPSQGDVFSHSELPKIEISKFSGDFSEWTPFFDKFSALIDETNLPDISKFSYLQSYLTGDAKKSVEGLSLTSANYPIALDILKERFGRKERIIFGHVQNLLGIDFHNARNVKSLWNVFNNLQINIRSLENLGVDGKSYGLILTPLIVSRLTPEMRLMWARKSSKREADLQFLLDFLQAEIENRDRSQSFVQVPPVSSSPKFETHGHRNRTPVYSTASSLVNGNSTSPSKETLCVFCGGRHFSDKCRSVSRMNVDIVRTKIKENSLCWVCFKKGHIASRCFSHCKVCGNKHNELFCGNNTRFKSNVDVSEDKQEAQKSDKAENANVTFCRSKLINKNTVLQTMRVNVKGVPVTILFDSGSDRSFITSKAVSLMKPSFYGREQLNVSTFESQTPSNMKTRNVYSVCFDHCSGEKENVLVTEVKTICPTMFRSAIPCKILSEFINCEFSEELQNDVSVTIDVLIGQDYYWKLIKAGSHISGSNGLVAQQTVMGPWILSGAYSDPSEPQKPISVNQFICLTDVDQSCFRKLWDLDYLDCGHVEKGDLQSQVLRDFNRNIRYVEGRYEVSLPWVDDKKTCLQSNEVAARKRLEKLDRKLSNEPALREGYDKVFATMEADKIIEEVPIEQSPDDGKLVFYLPHRPVVKMASSSTKIRPVFDASAPGPNALSLNDCMETGPNLLPLLSDVLMRFRRQKIAITADIEKAFLQVSVRPEDRDVHRFFWKVNEKIRTMRIMRVPFGNCASPFLLNATVRYHLSLYPSTKVVQELLENMYCDDWLSGGETVEEAVELMTEAAGVMNKAGMNLCKWNSNSAEVADKFQKRFEEKCVTIESTKVLGIRWVPEKDVFTFDGIVMSSEPDLVVTKRMVLSCIARIFDPLGFLCPFVISIKMLFQGIWKLGLTWDEEVPEDVASPFRKWIGSLKRLHELEIPRCYISLSWRNSQGFELHCFCDSSLKAYGAIIYLKVVEIDNSVSVSFLLSKARVCPLKPVTLPRLELLGAVIGAKLLRSVVKSLQLASVKLFCWTDSSIVLRWIRSDPTQWKMFVCNRVALIQELTEPEIWHHCPGKENPADCLTRGLSADEMLRKPLWFQGPPWLKNRIETQAQYEPTTVENSDVSEKRVEVKVCLTEVNRDAFLETERWGDFSKAVRVVAWVLRFVNRLKRKGTYDEMNLSLPEIEVANTKMLLYVQSSHFTEETECLLKKESVKKNSPLYKMNPFLDDQGLIRMKCRLELSELSENEKCPIILPRCHLTMLLVRREHLRLKHAGVSQVLASLRNQYWIIGMRSLAKRVKRLCVRCQRFDSKKCSQTMAPLPKERLRRSDLFGLCGVDFAGPLYTADFVGKKFYVLLFTCCAIRAVHIELCEGLSLNDFLLAFRRFVARRGMPSKILSDNAKTFQAAKKHLIDRFGEDGPKWAFNVPRAPWRGGIWERLVRSVKQALKKAISTRSLLRSELETTLIEIESCINGRPLTFVSDDPENDEPLTPSHFLLGRSDSHRSGTETTKSVITGAAAREGNSHIQMSLDKFWGVWQKDYIRNLPLVRSSPNNSPVKIGSLVLLSEDNCPRLHWPLGKVLRLFPGRDGYVRTIEIKTAKGIFVRPIQRVHVVELDDESAMEEFLIASQNMNQRVPRDEDVPMIKEVDKTKTNKCESSSNTESKQVVTARGRVVKRVDRLYL